MTHQFSDTEGRNWTLSINVSSIKRVRDAVGVDLLRVVEDNAAVLQRLLADPIELGAVLFTLCERQIEAAGIEPEAFGEGLSGDSLAQATEAMVGALVDFFPNAQDRTNLQKLWAKATEAGQVLGEIVGQKIDELDPRALAESEFPPPTSGGASGGQPATSGSIRAP